MSTTSIAAQNAALAKQSGAMGYVVAQPKKSPADSLTTKTLAYATFTIPAGQKFPVIVSGDYVYLDSITSAGSLTIAPLTVRPDTSNLGLPILTPGRATVFPMPFNSVSIENPAANDSITLSVFVGFGRVQRDPAGASTVQTVGALSTFNTALLAHAANVTPYADGQLVGAAGLSYSGLARVNGGSGRITGIQLWKNSATVLNASFRVYFSSANGAIPAGADQSAFQPPWIYGFPLSFVDIPSMIAEPGGTSAIGTVLDIAVPFVSEGNSRLLYYAVVAKAAYVPTSGEQFALSIWVDQN